MKKEKFTNRMLALAMSLCMIFTMMPMSAHATGTEHTCEWGEWVSNNDGTHTHTCMTDASHTETENCATYSYAMVEGQPYHNILCECMYVLDTEDHTMSEWYSDGDDERRDCTDGCDYFETRSIDTHTHDWKYRSVNDESHEPYCSGCEEVGIRSVHTYGNDGICTVCGHTQHTHNWEYRIVNESRHEPYCTGCEETGLQGMHTYGDDGACTACGYTEHTHNWEYRIVNESRHEPYCTECEETGLQGMHTWKYVPYGANTHQEVCTVCGYVGAKLRHENNNPNEDCSCDICGAEMYSAHDFERPTCVSGYKCKTCGCVKSGEPNLRNHVGFSAATCTTPATCACGATEGGKDPTNHTGGTEIRDAVAAGELTEGYTGDTHCKGCGAKLESGEVIPAKNYVVVKYTDDAVVEEVTFIASEGSAIPENAELVIDAYKAGVEQIPGSQHNDLTSVTLTDDEIEIITETSHTINGVTYTLYELIEINGTKYPIHGIHNDSFDLISLDSGDFFKLMFDFDGFLWRIQHNACELVVLSETCKININGVEYDIVLKRTGKSKYDIWYLYYNGSPAGQYHSTNGNADFLKGYDPATLSGKQDNGDLGTIIVSNPPVADLTVGTTYNVTVVGSNDIHLENAENISGTVTQTFDVPTALVGRTDVTFVAAHVLNPYAKELKEAYNKMMGLLGNEETHSTKDAIKAMMEYSDILARYEEWEQANAKVAYDFGDVTLSEDGKTLTAIYKVNSFSPFIVYAFVEADKPEIKTLSATIVDGTDDTSEAPDTNEPVVSPQTSDNTIWFILIAVVAGAIAVASVVYGKRRKNKAN